MNWLLSVDPGLKACGVALWSGSGVHTELVWARAVRASVVGRGPAAWGRLASEVMGYAPELGVDEGRVIVETMKVYANGKADPDDLFELQGISGAVTGVAVSRKWRADGVLAREWNGTVPSDIRRERTKAWVEARGWTSRVDLNTTARFQQDVWSAVGIGRYAFEGGR